MSKNNEWNGDKFSNKFTERKVEYLAGKPIRMRWWVLLLYMVPWLILNGAMFAPAVSHSIRTGVPFFPLIPATGSFICYWHFLCLCFANGYADVTKSYSGGKWIALPRQLTKMAYSAIC